VHGGLSQLLFTGLARHQTIAKPVIVDDPDLCLSHLHSTPRYRGVPSPSDYCQFAMAFDAEKLEWFGYPTLKKNVYFVPFFSYLTLNNIATL